MEENKNDIDELVKSIDSSFEEMSLKDIVAAHENYFGADDISFDKDKTEEEKKKEKAKVIKKTVLCTGRQEPLLEKRYHTTGLITLEV